MAMMALCHIAVAQDSAPREEGQTSQRKRLALWRAANSCVVKDNANDDQVSATACGSGNQLPAEGADSQKSPRKEEKVENVCKHIVGSHYEIWGLHIYKPYNFSAIRKVKH